MNRYWTLLLILASVWGASYLFIKVAVEGGLEPAPMMCARAAIAAAVLLVYVFRSLGRDRALAELPLEAFKMSRGEPVVETVYAGAGVSEGNPYAARTAGS